MAAISGLATVAPPDRIQVLLVLVFVRLHRGLVTLMDRGRRDEREAPRITIKRNTDEPRTPARHAHA